MTENENLNRNYVSTLTFQSHVISDFAGKDCSNEFEEILHTATPRNVQCLAEFTLTVARRLGKTLVP